MRLPEETYQAYVLLMEYHDIHVEVFGWRRRLAAFISARSLYSLGPVVNNYYVKDLSRLASELAPLSSTLKAKSNALANPGSNMTTVLHVAVWSSHQYVETSLEIVQALRDICWRFKQKSQGVDYSKAEYKAMVKTYEGLRIKFQKLGEMLNIISDDKRLNAALPSVQAKLKKD